MTPRRRTDHALALVEARQLASSGAGRMIREASNLSLAELGRAVGADASTIYRWETQERTPTGDLAVAYRDFLIELRETYATGRRKVPA
jgi:DNA-binding transcriptional regulator YiaG